MVGQAFSFDGSSSALTVDLNAPAGPYTIEAWVKYTGDSFARASYHTLFEFGNDSPWFGVESDGTLNMWGAVRGGRVPVGSWAHIAYTWNGANSGLYINGVQTAASSSAPSQGGQGLGIGQHLGDNVWLGLIDEPAIYGRALRAEEINAIVAAGYAGKCKASLAILTQPQSVTTNVTRQADFSVAAIGNGLLSYQWWKGQSPVGGATNSLLTLPDLQLSQAGDYWVVVSDTSGSVTSQVATLTLIPPPQISSLVPASAVAGNLVAVSGAHLAGATGVRIGNVNAEFSVASDDRLWVYVPAEAVSGLVSVTTLSGTAASAANLVITTTTQCQAPPAGLIGGWSGEGNGRDLIATNHGTMMGGAGFAQGMVGLAFSFDGENDYLQVPARALSAGTGDFTVQGWAKTTSTKSWNALVSCDYYSPGLYITGAGRLEVYPLAPSTAGGFNDGQWHHFALVRQAGVATYYKDGLAAGSIAYANSVNPTTFMIGWDGDSGDEFPGLIDEVALFNRALAPEEVAATFNARGAGMCGATDFRVWISSPVSGSRFDAGQSILITTEKQGGVEPITYAWYAEDGRMGYGDTAEVWPTAGQHLFTVIGTDNTGATNAASITVIVQAVPDLFPRITAFPATAVLGRQAVLQWSVTNQGTAKAEGPWYETILLADNAAGNNAQALFTSAYWGRLEPGQSIIRTQAVILPAGLAGQYWLGLSVDVYGHVFEGNGEANNLAMAAAATELTAPDLVVESIAAAPNAYFGQGLQVTWVVRNVGDAAVDTASSDQLVFRSESGSGGEWPLGWFAAPKLLAAGEAYTNIATVTLPLTEALAAGNFFVHATADANGVVSESIEWNNTNSTPVFRVTMPPLPDLTVVNIGVFSTNAGAAEPLAQVQPGQTVRLTWVTTNQGPAAAGGGWTEKVFLSGNPAQSSGQTIATFTVTNALAAGQFLARTQTAVIPIDSEIGSLRFGVQTDSGYVLLEENESNNLAWAEQPVQVPGTLTFQLSGASVAEGQRLSGFVWRNGSRAQALTITLAGSDNSELAVTSPVVIDAGQSAASFEVQGVSDGMVDGPQLVQLTASVADFASAEAAITVLDVDIPKLTLQLAAAELLEGASLQGTITRELVTAQPLTVYLSKSGSSRLQVTEVVTIAANQAGASFTVNAQDNWKVEGPRACAISAQATGYQSTSAALTLLDNDLPAFSMSLNTTNVSEGGGPQAAVATLARMPVTVEPLYVELVSTDTNVVRVPALVAVAGGETSLTVPVAAVDNTETNAARLVRVDAYLLDALTGERLSLAPDASVTLLVSDDDGPTLRLVIAKKIVGEGLRPATTATVSRNTGTSGALVVELASRDTSEATVPEYVTIPDGKNSVTFEINSVADGVTDGSQMVAIVASHDNYVGGSDTLTVTDSDLPDLTVAVLQSPGTVETEAYTLISYRFANDGTAPTQGTVVLRAYLSHDEFLSGEDMLLEEYTYTGDLPLEVPIQRSASVRMPREAGRYWVIVQADGSAVGAPELRLDNNVAAAAQPTIVTAAYAAQVWAIDHSAPAGTSIRLAGKVFTGANQPVPYGLASIHVMQGSLTGSQRIIAAVADAQGNFTTSFVPLGSEAGVYLIGATHPGSSDVVEQDRFRLLGIEAKPAWVQMRVTEGSTARGSVTLINPADVPLTGVSVGVAESSANLEVTGAASDTLIPGLSSITLNYEIKALEASLYRAYAVVRVACAQGVSVDVPFYVTVDPLLPQLVATPTELAHGMKRGEQTVVEFEVVNLGGAETGPLTVFLPALDWLTLVSTNPMPSLLPGGASTNRVLLLLSPSADMVLGEYPGRLAINGTNTSLGVAFNFRAMSEAHGDLLVIAEDEYTFHAQGSPHVTNAAVVVRDAVSGTVVTNGFTDAQGQFFAAGLVENYYQIEVSAEQHSSYRGTSLLMAGRVNEVHAFMPRQAVQYIWKVEPTEIEDRTKITIETTFETMVPMPVITVQPNLIDLDEYANSGVGYLEMMVTNHGLVAGLDATITFDAHELWEIKPLVENLGTLSAMGGMVVPVQIRRLTNAALSRCDIPCQINGRVSYSLLSGGNTYRYSVPLLAVHAWANCVCPSPTPPPCVGCSGGPGWYPGPGGGGIVIPVDPPTPQYEPPSQCVPHLDGVCAKVKLRLDQEAVLSRDAFKATLELINGTTLDLSGVRIVLDIRNSEGALVTNLFGIYPPSLTGMGAVDGTGVVGANATGTAQWIIVPSVDAAPSKPVQYKVGGTLAYVDNGQAVTIDLAPTPITVYPLPQIKLDYFHERDVVADDPFTAPKEPSMPYNLAVLAQNTGRGDAHKLRIVSAQPKIVENLSGLLIDFKIIATEVAGQNMTPTLTADFGEIPAGTTKVARWLLTSTLQGQFTEYKATFQHQDDLGNPRLLIITNVAIHEMTHLVEAPAPFADGEPDFLVNEQLNDPRDATDPYDLPDTVYLSDGSRHPVALVLESTVNGTVSAGHYSIEIEVPAPGKGFVYARVPEPTAGQYPLTRVVRSDGVEITLDKNAWVTDRTFRSPYERPIYEHNLHLFDYNSSGRYTLYYEAPAAPDNTAPESQVQALPASSRPQIALQWAGADAGGGIAAYDLYVSEEGGAFALIPSLRNTTATSAIFEGQAGRRYAFYSVATDRAGNREAAPASADTETLVSLANQAPLLGAFSEQVINEGETFAYLVTASDPDLPQDQLSFEISGQPAGLTLTKISATQALLQWATGEADGPGAYELAVTVRDGQSPQLSDTKTLRVVVNEVNTPPVLEAVGFRRVNKGQWLMVTNQARDFDLPAQNLVYSLGAGAPAGMNINPLNGLLSWQPESAQAGKTNVVAVIARDNGSPSLSATQWLTVAVRNLGPDFTVSVGTTNLFAGESGSVPLNLKSGLSLKELTFALGGAGSDRLSDWNLSDMREGLGATLRPRAGAPGQYELSFSASEADPLHGTFVLARLGFRAVATNSGVALLLPQGAAGVTTEGQTNANSAAVYGRVFVVVEEPILDALPMNNQTRTLVLYGLPGRDYVLESKARLADPGAWTEEKEIHLVGPMQVIISVLEAPEDRFFRAYMIRNP